MAYEYFGCDLLISHDHSHPGFWLLVFQHYLLLRSGTENRKENMRAEGIRKKDMEEIPFFLPGIFGKKSITLVFRALNCLLGASGPWVRTPNLFRILIVL